MPSVIFHEAALDELEQAATWYEQNSPELGDGFFAEIEHAVRCIRDNPEAWPAYIRETRQFILSRFPFSVVYRNRGNVTEVVAVRHHRRRPAYWIERLSQ